MTDKLKMDAATAEALEKSILHWKENAAAETTEDVEIGPHSCALCRLFFFGDNQCLRCPVMDSTGRNVCSGTPYNNTIDALDEWAIAGERSDQKSKWDAKRDAFRAAALAEVAFLESLRDAP